MVTENEAGTIMNNIKYEQYGVNSFEFERQLKTMTSADINHSMLPSLHYIDISYIFCIIIAILLR